MLLEILINFFILGLTNSENYNQYISSDILEDSLLVTPQLITKYGYPAEIHEIVTDDGYYLELHRIKNNGKKPILLVHGLSDSSATFIFMGPRKSLGYYLWQMGYDVWLGNVRGNRYSQKHKILNVDDYKFWQFSWHEIGIYDLPAMIDYIIDLTKYQKISYIGHSQGTTVFFVMCSKKPEYNSKIDLMQALAPAAYLSHIRSPLRIIVENILQIFPEELIQRFSSNHGMYKNFCTLNPFAEEICFQLWQNIVGKDHGELNKTMIPVILGHIPAGSCVRQFKHYIQIIKSNKFQEYNFGESKNIEKYGNINPPDYNLSLITAPVIFHYSLDDYLVHPIDVNRSYNELGNPKGKFLAPNIHWNHMDFIWSINARNLFYGRLLKYLKDFEN